MKLARHVVKKMLLTCAKNYKLIQHTIKSEQSDGVVSLYCASLYVYLVVSRVVSEIVFFIFNWKLVFVLM